MIVLAYLPDHDGTDSIEVSCEPMMDHSSEAGDGVKLRGDHQSLRQWHLEPPLRQHTGSAYMSTESLLATSVHHLVDHLYRRWKTLFTGCLQTSGMSACNSLHNSLFVVSSLLRFKKSKYPWKRPKRRAHHGHLCRRGIGVKVGDPARHHHLPSNAVAFLRVHMCSFSMQPPRFQGPTPTIESANIDYLLSLCCQESAAPALLFYLENKKKES